MSSPKLISKFSLAMAAAIAVASATAQNPAQPAAPQPAAPQPAAPQPDEVIMTVDGSPITQADFQERFTARFAPQLQQMSPQQQQQAIPRIQQMIMGELVQKTLLLNAADAKGVKATEEDVANTLKEISATLPEGSTLEQFVASRGLSMDRIKEQVASDLRIEKLIDGVTKDIAKPTDEAVKAYFDENPEEFEQKEAVKARHILIKTQGITDETQLAEKKAQAEAIRAELVAKKGENFAEVAKEKSEGPSGPSGGDLGEFGRGAMVPEFEAAAFAQEVNAVGELVKTDFGYHIIQVQEKKAAGKKAFADVKEEITEGLHNEARNGEIQKYLGELEAKAKIVQPGLESATEGAEPEAPAPAPEKPE